jgi:hypothetical protein
VILSDSGSVLKHLNTEISDTELTTENWPRRIHTGKRGHKPVSRLEPRDPMFDVYMTTPALDRELCSPAVLTALDSILPVLLSFPRGGVHCTFCYRGLEYATSHALEEVQG